MMMEHSGSQDSNEVLVVDSNYTRGHSFLAVLSFIKVGANLIDPYFNEAEHLKNLNQQVVEKLALFKESVLLQHVQIRNASKATRAYREHVEP